MGRMMTVLVTATPQEMPLRAGPGVIHKTKEGNHAGVPGGPSLSQLAFSGFLRGFSNGLSETAQATPASRPSESAQTSAPRSVDARERPDRDTATAPAIAPRERPDAPSARPVEEPRPVNSAEARPLHDAATPARPAHPAAKADAGAARPLTAHVTQEAPILISQPSSALSARAAVAAQTPTQASATPSSPASATASESTAQTAAGPLQQALSHQHPKGRLGRLTNSGQPATAVAAAGAKAAPAALTPQAIGMIQGTGQGTSPSAASLANTGQNGQAVRPSIFPSTAGVLAGSGAEFAAQRASAPPPLPRPPVPVPPRLVTNQVSVHIQKAVGQGVDQIRIHLKPAELGRVDVKLDVAPDGRVNVAVSVENPDTLDLLQRDARALQNALQDAGLRADSDSLQFALKGHGKNFGGRDGSSASDDAGDLADQQEPPVPPAGLATGQTADGRIDIEV